MRRNEDYPSYYYKDIEGTAEIGLERSAGEPFRELKVYGESVQNGTPSPDNPIPVESVGERTKNLLDIQNVDKTLIRCVLENVNNGVKIIATENNKAGYISINLNDIVTVGETYSISFVSERSGSTGGGIRVTIDGELSINMLNYNGGYYNGTFTAGTTNILMLYACTNSGYIDDFAIFKNIQVEVGDTATEYEPFGYKIPITARGKNLFDGVFKYGVIYANSGDSNEYGERKNCIFTLNYIPIKPNTEYTMTNGISNKNQKIRFYDKDKNYIGYSYKSGEWLSQSANSLIKTGVTPDDAYYARFELDFDTIESASSVLNGEHLYMLEEGNTATEYEPYKEPIHSTIYLKEPLRKINNYADELDVIGKKVTRNIFEYTLTDKCVWGDPQGELDMTIRSYSNYETIPRIRSNYGMRGFSEKGVFTGNTTASDANCDFEYCQFVNGSSGTTSTLFVRILKSRCADPENPAKSDFTNIYTPGIKVYGVRETPIEEPILLSEEIKILKRNCQLRVKTSLSPSKVKAQYYRF